MPAERTTAPVVRRDWNWADQFIPVMKRLIGPCLLGPATLEQDRSENSDLVVLLARDMKIACRVRRPEYRERYPNQFTIRSRRSSGAQTELAKILEGWGDWFFYGHTIPGCVDIVNPWWLLNLEVFRREYSRSVALQQLADIPNGDGTWFKAFHFHYFRAVRGFLIASAAHW